MKNLERYFYIALAVVLGVLLLWKWNCSGRCPEIVTTQKSDTTFRPLIIDTAATLTWLRPKSIKKSNLWTATSIKRRSLFDSSYLLKADSSWTLQVDTAEWVDVTDLFDQKNYDTTYHFKYGDIQVLTDVERNRIIKQTVIPSWRLVDITNTVYVPEVKTIYEGRRQLYLGADVYGMKGSIFNGVGGSIMYKTKKDFAIEAGVLKINSLPLHYYTGAKIKIHL